MPVELNLYVSQLTSKQKASAAVQHALAVQRALALGNYHAFFEQYLMLQIWGHISWIILSTANASARYL